ncbi:SRPBCC family protein [Thermocatellispora tengchongensis]|uniref:SRPBCC family protein n=1 Tax=Thermocatellispora tengchongensis TaxID=1073253 RepID=UPI00363216AB
MKESLGIVDGRPALRMERTLKHPPEKVWRAITEPAELSRWYPLQVAAMDLHVGGTIRFDDGQGTMVDAVITELDPPHVFAFSERAPESMQRESEDLVHFELRPDPAGCLLIFTHVFDDRYGAASYGSGWHTCLAVLEAALDGREAELPGPQETFDLHESYIKKFALDEGTISVSGETRTIRYERQIMMRPVDAVWTALTEGGASYLPEAVPPGKVTEERAPELLAYEWLHDGEPAGTVRWELSNGPGGARIVLTQTVPASLPTPCPPGATT